MRQTEIETRLSVGKLNHTPGEEEQYFMDNSDFPKHHEGITRDRLCFLGAFRAAVTPVIERFLKMDKLGPILEVGCGAGFFSRHLAPDWLKDRLISFDVNLPSLQTMRATKTNDNTPFQGSIYRLPIKSGSLDAVIGYSSFDSFLHLDKALQEVKRILKPGGRLILFQDLTTGLYQPRKIDPEEGEKESVEIYHLVLVDEVSKGGFFILEGREDYLEALVIEPISKVCQRVPDFELEERPFPIVANWDRGPHHPIMRLGRRLELQVKKEQVDKEIDGFCKNLQQRPPFNRLGAKAGDLIELLTMHYLVAEKPT